MTVGPWRLPRGEQQAPPGPTRAALIAAVLTLVVLAAAWQSAGPGGSSWSDAGTPADDGRTVPTIPFADAVADRVDIGVGPLAGAGRPIRTDLVDTEMERLRLLLIRGDTPRAVDHLIAATLRMGTGPERALLLERATEFVAGPQNVPAASVGNFEDVIARLAIDPTAPATSGEGRG